MKSIFETIPFSILDLPSLESFYCGTSCFKNIKNVILYSMWQMINKLFIMQKLIIILVDVPKLTNDEVTINDGFSYCETLCDNSNYE